MAEPGAELLPAALAARFRPLGLLGTGAFGRVVLAEDQSLSRRVAVKVLGRRGDEFEARFAREAQLTARLVHPHVVAVYDHGVDDGTSWIVYEHVEGESLHTRLERDGRLAPRTVARLGAELAGALGAAHRLGILHRDLKPANVLLRADGRAVLVDFGLGLDAKAREHLTKTGAVVGTVTYLPPEVVRGEPAGPAADQWGLAATLYRALTGELVRFEGVAPGEPGIEAKALGAPPVLAAGLEGAVERLGRVLLVGLAPDPARRFPDPEALAVALDAALEEPGRARTPRAGSPAPPRPGSGARRVPGRGAAVRLGLGLALTFALVLGGIRALGPGAGPDDGGVPAGGAPPEGAELGAVVARLDRAHRLLARPHDPDDPDWSRILPSPSREGHVEALGEALFEPRYPGHLRRYLEACGELARTLAATPGARLPAKLPVGASILDHLQDDLATAERLAGNAILFGPVEDRARAARRVTSLQQVRQEVSAALAAFVADLTPWTGRYDSPFFHMRIAAEGALALGSILETLDAVHAAVLDPDRPEALPVLLAFERELLCRVPPRLLADPDRIPALLAASAARVAGVAAGLGPGGHRRELAHLLFGLMVYLERRKGPIPPAARDGAEALLAALAGAGPFVPPPGRDDPEDPGRRALELGRAARDRHRDPWLVEFVARLGAAVGDGT